MITTSQTKTIRKQRAQRNIYSSLVMRFIALGCGIIIPQLLIKSYGSEAYGATASIAQFLSYIALLEGGIGGVARAALYKPLARHDFISVSKILNEIKFLFQMIGWAFLGYVVIIACCFKNISHIQCYDWFSTALLVFAISLSTFAQYFIGISNQVLLQADQKSYISNVINVSALFLNTLLVILLVHLNYGLIAVKFVSAFIFILRPCAMYWYVHTNYPLVKVKGRDKKALKQKWSGLGQHLAFFFHSNTDVVILTLFTNLKIVAIYAVYHMITSQIQQVVSSFTTGIEALFGDMLARGEIKSLNRVFGFYETLISLIALPLSSVTILLIVPFVQLYTHAVTDTNYIQPLFSFLLVLAALLYCLRVPYHELTIAAGHFKQTRWAAYGEAGFNILLSIVLVQCWGLVGIALGTVIAILFRWVYYVFYIANHLIFRNIMFFLKRMLFIVVTMLLMYITGEYCLSFIRISTYIQWALAGTVLVLVSFTISYVSIRVCYPQHLKIIIKNLKRKKS